MGGGERTGKENHASETRWGENVHVSRLEFVRSLGDPLSVDARDLDLGGVEAGRVVHHEADLGVDGVHGCGLGKAKVGLQ